MRSRKGAIVSRVMQRSAAPTSRGLLQEDGANEAVHGGLEDADHVGAAFDLTIKGFERISNRHDARGDPGSAEIRDLRLWCEHPGCGALRA